MNINAFLCQNIKSEVQIIAMLVLWTFQLEMFSAQNSKQTKYLDSVDCSRVCWMKESISG